jgi:hypothetical protein
MTNNSHIYHVGYDLLNPGQNYDSLIERLKKAGATKYQFSGWLLRTGASATQVYAYLRPTLDANDKLTVVEINASNTASSDPNIALSLGVKHGGLLSLGRLYGASNGNRSFLGSFADE